ncbi:MAG: hypothetical protein ACYC3A_05820 [Halothiobacillus sp.]
MNLGRCPICHSRLNLEAMVQDESGRELIALMAGLEVPLAVPLVSYLGLFRPENRDLSNDRALKLAREVLEIGFDDHMATALSETVEAIRSKGGIALKNHNYLKRVWESVEAKNPPVIRPENRPEKPAKPSQTTRTEAAISGFLGVPHE